MNPSNFKSRGFSRGHGGSKLSNLSWLSRQNAPKTRNISKKQMGYAIQILKEKRSDVFEEVEKIDEEIKRNEDLLKVNQYNLALTHLKVFLPSVCTLFWSNLSKPVKSRVSRKGIKTLWKLLLLSIQHFGMGHNRPRKTSFFAPCKKVETERQIRRSPAFRAWFLILNFQSERSQARKWSSIWIITKFQANTRQSQSFQHGMSKIGKKMWIFYW